MSRAKTERASCLSEHSQLLPRRTSRVNGQDSDSPDSCRCLRDRNERCSNHARRRRVDEHSSIHSRTPFAIAIRRRSATSQRSRSLRSTPCLSRVWLSWASQFGESRGWSGARRTAHLQSRSELFGGACGSQSDPKQRGERKSPSRKPTITSSPTSGAKTAPRCPGVTHRTAHIGSAETAGIATSTRPRFAGSAVFFTMARRSPGNSFTGVPCISCDRRCRVSRQAWPNKGIGAIRHAV